MGPPRVAPMNPRGLLESCGGRRFLMTLGCGVACTFLRWHDRLTDSGFQTIILATVGAYIAANTYQKGRELVAGSRASP